MTSMVQCPKCAGKMACHARTSCNACRAKTFDRDGAGVRMKALGISVAQLVALTGVGVSTAKRAQRGIPVTSYRCATLISQSLGLPVEAIAEGKAFYEQALKRAERAANGQGAFSVQTSTVLGQRDGRTAD